MIKAMTTDTSCGGHFVSNQQILRRIMYHCVKLEHFSCRSKVMIGDTISSHGMHEFHSSMFVRSD